MDFNIENDRSTDARVGWYVKSLTYDTGEISGLLVFSMVFAYLFSSVGTSPFIEGLESSPSHLGL